MVNIVIENYEIDAPWMKEALSRYLRPRSRVVIVAFSFRDDVKSAADWDRLYGKEGRDREGMVKPFAAYGIAEEDVDFINWFADTHDSARACLAAADVVLLPGGNTAYLMRRIKAFGLAEALRNFSGVLLGMSAGALVQLAEYHLSPDEDEPVFCYGRGLGVLNGFYLEVHYEAGADQNAAIARVRRERKCPVYATAAGAGMLIVEDGRVTPVGEVRVFHAPDAEEAWFAALAQRLGLGLPLTAPRPLSGGFMHKMYALTTDRGEYAVKRLNPHVMARPEAMDNFRRAEALEETLEARDLPILPARRWAGQKMQALDGHYCYVFDYFAGRALSPEEITPAHTAKIGETLARIHAVDRRADGFEPDTISIDWEKYLAPLADADPEAEQLLREHLPLLARIQARRNAAVKKLSPRTAICHGDMDRKNVLWRGEEFRVIDLECLNYAQPELELTELLLCWSGLETGVFDAECLRSFARGYESAGGELPRDWETLLDANWDRLYWLRYNVERILGIGASPEEKPLGQRETRKTLAEIRWIEANRAAILKTL